MKVLILGKKYNDFPSRETGEQITGFKVFYASPGQHITGMGTSEQWIGAESPFFSQFKSLDLAKPVTAEFIFESDMFSKSKKPYLTDFKVGKPVEIAL